MIAVYQHLILKKVMNEHFDSSIMLFCKLYFKLVQVLVFHSYPSIDVKFSIEIKMLLIYSFFLCFVIKFCKFFII